MCLGHISSHLNKEVSLRLHLQGGYKTCLKVQLGETAGFSVKKSHESNHYLMLSLKQKNESAVFIISLPRHFNFVSTFLFSYFCLWVACFKDSLFFIWLFHIVSIIMTRCNIPLGTYNIPGIIVSTLHALSNVTFSNSAVGGKSYFLHIIDEDKGRLSLKILFLQASIQK